MYSGGEGRKDLIGTTGWMGWMIWLIGCLSINGWIIISLGGFVVIDCCGCFDWDIVLWIELTWFWSFNRILWYFEYFGFEGIWLLFVREGWLYKGGCWLFKGDCWAVEGKDWVIEGLYEG